LTAKEFNWLFLAGTVVVATVLWFVTFYLSWSTFWIKITISAATLACLAVWLQPGILKGLRFDMKTIVTGLLSAAALYFIFWIGKFISTTIFFFAGHQIGSIYGKGEGTPLWVIALLLFFITGPGEELFWRGYLQKNLMKRFGGVQGWLVTTVIYAGVHIWSFNFMLIGAAAVAGAFWGAQYWRFGRLAPVIVSHAVWSTVIFAVAPLS